MHDHALRIRRAVVVEQAIGAAGLHGKAVHHRLHNSRNRRVERRAGFARLEEHVGILRRAANERAIGRERVLAERDQVLVVDHGADGLVADGQNLAHLVRGAEAVEEMNERNARFERGDLRHQRQVGNFLHGIRRQHRPAGRAAGHHVGVVAKDRERVRGQRARRNVHRRRGQLAGNLEHVGDHQQQALRGGKRGAEGPGLQRAVQCAGRAAFALHLFHNGQCAPDILLPFRAPLIGPLGHRRRGGDGVDGDDFGESIGNRGRSLVPVHNHGGNHSLWFTHSLRSTVRPLGRLAATVSLFAGHLGAVMRGTRKAKSPIWWNDVHIVQRCVDGVETTIQITFGISVC